MPHRFHLAPSPRHSTSIRRGSVIVVVIWALAIAALAIAALQLVTYRHAVVSREVMGRVQARWAARAGVEETIAVMAFNTEFPDANDAFRLVREMEDVSYGEVQTGTWDIRHFSDGREWAGPMDENSKLHVSRASPALLLNFRRMTQDIADAFVDWQDTNDDVDGQGAEWQYYANLSFRYRPRNDAIRTQAEAELVAGVWPQDWRGEDWNLNNRLDPNEDDGSITWPNDKSDGILDPGWSGYLTPYSLERVTGISGDSLVDLKQADAQTLMNRLGLDEDQANALKTWGASQNAKLGDLLVTDLGQLALQANPNRGQAQDSGASSGGGMGGAGGPRGGGPRGGGARGGGEGATEFEFEGGPAGGPKAAGAGGGGGGAAFGGAGGGGRGGAGGAAGGGRGGAGGGAGGGRGGGGRGAAIGGLSGASAGRSGRGGDSATAGQLANTKPLSVDQLRTIFQEATMEVPQKAGPGKINLNTASAELLREVFNFEPKLADQIVHLRQTRKEGITSLVDLMEIKDITPQTIQALEAYADTVSNVYSITARGRSAATGLEVEIFAVVDRSTLPVRILEYRER